MWILTRSHDMINHGLRALVCGCGYVDGYDVLVLHFYDIWSFVDSTNVYNFSHYTEQKRISFIYDVFEIIILFILSDCISVCMFAVHFVNIKYWQLVYLVKNS